MCSFIDAFKHLLLRKTKILKTWLKGKYLGNKIWRNSFEEQKGTMYIWENLYFGIIIFSCHPSTKPCLRFMLNCFAQEIKGFHQSSLGNEVNYRDIMNVSPNILAKNYNFKKLRHGFVDERALITTTSISSCHWKTLVYTFLPAKEKNWKHIFNTNSELTQNLTEKIVIQNNSKLAISWYMMLFSHGLFWLKNWHFLTSSCKGFIISLIQRGFWVFPKIKVGNICNPCHGVIIIPFSTS